MWVITKRQFPHLKLLRPSSVSATDGSPVLNPLRLALLKWAPYTGVKFPIRNYPWGIAFDGANMWVTYPFTDQVTKVRVSDGVVLNSIRITNPQGAKHAAAIEARHSLNEAFSAMRDSEASQRTAFNNLGGLVQTDADGNATYIMSCGFGVRSNGTPAPPVEDPPYALRTQVNGTPGKVLLSWRAPVGARYFEAQSTTDLSGETGWVSTGQMPTKTKTDFEGLTSGTRYAFRVRAWGNGMPGPWSTPVQQRVL